MQLLKGGNSPEQLAMQLAEQYPEFGKFLDANRNKSVDQLLQEYNIKL